MASCDVGKLVVTSDFFPKPIFNGSQPSKHLFFECC
jgi:hypothetical protein